MNKVFKLKLFFSLFLTYLGLVIIELLAFYLLFDAIISPYIRFYLYLGLFLIVNTFLTFLIVLNFNFDESLYKANKNHHEFMKKEVILDNFEEANESDKIKT